MSDHIDIERLLAYAHGEVYGPEAEAILAHSRVCGQCGDQLGVMLALRSDGIGHGESAPQTRWVALVAASVALAALLGVALMRGGFGSRFIDGATRGDDLANLATTEGPSRVDLDFLFDSSLTASTDAILPQKRAGFELIVSRQYGEAIELLSALRNTRPGDSDVAATLGIALYLSGDSDSRVEALLLEGNNAWLQGLRHYATWYLGNHYLRHGDLVQAMGALQKIAQEPDAPGRRANDLLRRLQVEVRQ